MDGRFPSRERTWSCSSRAATFSYTQGTMFGKPTDAHPMEFPLARSHMRRGFYGAKSAGILVTALFFQVYLLSVISEMQAHAASTPYPSMAPLDQYLIADQNVEIALARSAAPKSISDSAEVLTLGCHGVWLSSWTLTSSYARARTWFGAWYWQRRSNL